MLVLERLRERQHVVIYCLPLTQGFLFALHLLEVLGSRLSACAHPSVRSSVCPVPCCSVKMSNPMICNDCAGTSFVEDRSAGDIICRKCGLVAESHVIDERSEWRTFADKVRPLLRLQCTAGCSITTKCALGTLTWQ